MEEVVDHGVKSPDEFGEMEKGSSRGDRCISGNREILSGLRNSIHSEGRTSGLLFGEVHIEEGAGSRITAKSLLKLIERQGYCCAMSGVALTPENAAVDHVIPVSRGGSHGIENLQVLHEEVNAAKRNMLPEDFIEMCVNVANHAGRL